MSFTALVMAAGKGTRMRSRVPKVLHEVCGRPMVAWPVGAALAAGADEVIVVQSADADLAAVLPAEARTAVQREPDGTAGAVVAGIGEVRTELVVILSGDVPLVTEQQIAGLIAAHTSAGVAATMVTCEVPDPTGYGRVVRDDTGGFERVVETKDTAGVDERELLIAEVNTGVFCFDVKALREALSQVPTNPNGERYLPDVLQPLRTGGVLLHQVDDHTIVLGINDRVGLAAVSRVAQDRILREHQLAGVTIVEPASTIIDAGVTIGIDTKIEPSTILRGATSIGEDCTIGPDTTIVDTSIGDGVTVRCSYCDRAVLDAGVNVGPFAYLRPGAHLHENSKAGTFVEIKNSEVGAGSKVPHLSYIGDADIGERSNLGAGTITANYDGREKHRTRIGSGVRSGVDVSFVAPVEVGDDAWTAAGSIITDDVPPRALAIARQRQSNVEDYADRDGSR